MIINNDYWTFNVHQFTILSLKEFLKSFIKVYFTVKIHPFKVYNSAVLTIFTELPNHHHCLI